MLAWSDDEQNRLKELFNKTSGRNNVTKDELKEVAFLLKKKQNYLLIKNGTFKAINIIDLSEFIFSDDLIDIYYILDGQLNELKPTDIFSINDLQNLQFFVR